MDNSIIISDFLDVIPEDSPIGAIVGHFSLAEPVSEPVQYTLTAFLKTWQDSPADGISVGNFVLDGDTMSLREAVDYETMNGSHGGSDVYKIIISAYSNGTLVADKGFDLSVGDVLEEIRMTSTSARGDVGADKIIGTSHDDRIVALRGDDIIYGAKGKDVMFGGEGADTFLFKKASDSIVKNPDIIGDWDHEAGNPVRDHIDLRSFDANTKIAGLEDFDWIGSKAFSGNAGELRYEKQANYTYVYADLDGDKKADFAISIHDSIKMYADDFLL